MANIPLVTIKFPGLDDTYTIPTNTSDLTNDSGFGTYSKPSGGIPASDLAAAAQTSLGKADTALQPNDLPWEFAQIDTSVDGWKLKSDGFCESDASYKLVKYRVAEGQVYKVVSDDKFQFQTVADVPGGGTNNRVGDTYSTGTYVLTVPSTATYLIVSTLITGSAAAVYNARPAPSDSTPSPLGTAAAGSSSAYAKGDHVHAMPSASDVGAIAAPSSPSSGQFLVYNGSAWVAQSLSTWSGGSY